MLPSTKNNISVNCIFRVLNASLCIFLINIISWVSVFLHRSCWQIRSIWIRNGAWFLFLQPCETFPGWGLCCSFKSSFVNVRKTSLSISFG
jgi:hypothetical protein